MTNDEYIELKQSELLCDTEPLSPEKEAEWRNAFERVLTKNAELLEENADLKQQLAWFKKQVYGQKSEKTEVIIEGGEQVHMFNEAENESTVDPKRIEESITVAEHKRKAKSTHAETFENLPIEEVVHEVEDRTCPECGSEMETIGKEFVRDEVVFVPARLFVRKHYTEVVKCPECGNDESKDDTLPDVPAPVFKKASAPSPVIPRSYCSPELLAHIIFQKYCQGVPLYRQEKEYKALGLSLSRTTMANWIIYAGEKYAGPICERMKEALLKEKVIHADETVVQVLHEPDKKAKTESRMWVYSSPKESLHRKVLFKYASTRNGDNAVKFLGEYSGYIVCDGYDGYNKLTESTRTGCFAHARRKFVDALPTEAELIPTSKAAEGVEWCNKLYMLEREYLGIDAKGNRISEPMTLEEKRKARAERSKAVLDGFYEWLNTVNPSGGTKLAKAVQYAKNEKAYLSRFVDDPIIPIDNNIAENSVRPFVIGRKNWLFCDSVKGAESSAYLYSLAVSAIANGMNAEKYFTDVLSSRGIVMPW